MGVGGAGKTCVLESLKTRFSPMPGLAPAQIVPTVGLNLARLEVPAARGGGTADRVGSDPNAVAW